MSELCQIKVEDMEDDEGMGVDVLGVWTKYQEFELCHYDEAYQSISQFLSEWQERMCSALAMGCQYSDFVLAFKLLEKSSLEDTQVLTILKAIKPCNAEDNLLAQTIDKIRELKGEAVTKHSPKRGWKTRVKKEKSRDDSGRKLSNGRSGTSVSARLDSDAEGGDNFDEEESERTKDEDNSESDGDDEKASCDVKENQCPVCLKIFSRKYDVEPHMKTHLGLKEFECDECGKSFARKNHLNVHKQLNRCPSKRRGQRRVARVVSTGGVGGDDAKKFTCSLCDKSFDHMARLRAHFVKHTGEKPYKCSFCSEHFASYNDLYKHRRSHPEAADFICIDCNRDYKNAETYKNHREKMHGEIEEIVDVPGHFPCQHCPARFASSVAYVNHCQEAHGLSNPFQCDICGKVCHTKQSLKVHKLIHSEVKPFQCSLCDKSFCQSSGLKAHFRTHSGEKPFRCDECGKCFAIKKTLIIHERIHTNERPYACSECGKTFAHLHVMKIHVNSHTGERPYVCTVCSKAYTRPDKLKAHMKTHKEVETSAVGSNYYVNTPDQF